MLISLKIVALQTLHLPLMRTRRPFRYFWPSCTNARVECYAGPAGSGGAEIIALVHDGAVPGSAGGYFYCGRIPGIRPAGDYTVRVMPMHRGIRVPAENVLIRWQR